VALNCQNLSQNARLWMRKTPKIEPDPIFFFMVDKVSEAENKRDWLSEQGLKFRTQCAVYCDC